MDESISRGTVQRYARICGVLYLYIIAAGTLAEIVVRSGLVVPADAAATASNIAANERLFRVGFSAELLHLASDVAVSVILYALLRPVHRVLARLTLFFRTGCILVLATASISHFAALRLLGGSEYLGVFRTDQLQALALLALKLHGDAYAISLVFFGFSCLTLGYLVFASTYLPRVIGLLLAVAGVCYLVSSFTHFLAPAASAALMPGIFVPIFVAELALSVWLVAKGVNVDRWAARTGRPSATLEGI